MNTPVEMPSATMLHGRTLQLVFASAHFLVLATYLQPALDLAGAGEFTILFFVPALVLTLLVAIGCTEATYYVAQTNHYLAISFILGMLCVLAWVSPIVMLFVTCALGAAWSARARSDGPLLFGGTLVLFVTVAALVFMCSRLPVDAMVAASTRLAAELRAKHDAPAQGASAIDTSAPSVASGLPALAPYPASVQPLPQLELGTAILQFMPSAERGFIEWDFNADGPVAWKTEGYTSDAGGDRSYRDGLLRVHVLGTFSTVLRQSKNELAWRVQYTTADNPKWGPQSIELQPGVEQEGGCFGTLYTGCAFDPRPSMARAGIDYSVVCRSPSKSNGSTVFALSYPGRAPMLLTWSISTGSGGDSSWLEMRIHRDAEPVTCA